MTEGSIGEYRINPKAHKVWGLLRHTESNYGAIRIGYLEEQFLELRAILDSSKPDTFFNSMETMIKNMSEVVQTGLIFGERDELNITGAVVEMIDLMSELGAGLGKLINGETTMHDFIESATISGFTFLGQIFDQYAESTSIGKEEVSNEKVSFETLLQQLRIDFDINNLSPEIIALIPTEILTLIDINKANTETDFKITNPSKKLIVLRQIFDNLIGPRLEGLAKFLDETGELKEEGMDMIKNRAKFSANLLKEAGFCIPLMTTSPNRRATATLEALLSQGREANIIADQFNPQTSVVQVKELGTYERTGAQDVGEELMGIHEKAILKKQSDFIETDAEVYTRSMRTLHDHLVWLINLPNNYTVDGEARKSAIQSVSHIEVITPILMALTGINGPLPNELRNQYKINPAEAIYLELFEGETNRCSWDINLLNLFRKRRGKIPDFFKPYIINSPVGSDTKITETGLILSLDCKSSEELNLDDYLDVVCKGSSKNEGLRNQVKKLEATEYEPDQIIYIFPNESTTLLRDFVNFNSIPLNKLKARTYNLNQKGAKGIVADLKTWEGKLNRMRELEPKKKKVRKVKRR